MIEIIDGKKVEILARKERKERGIILDSERCMNCFEPVEGGRQFCYFCEDEYGFIS
ncbi:hypothetical protein ES703_59922 [subsurface metagenome]